MRARLLACSTLAVSVLVRCLGEDVQPGKDTPTGPTQEAGADATADGGCADGFATCVGGTCATNIATSAEHCGACGHVCEGTATCSGGRCQPEVLAAGFPLPYGAPLGNGLVVDAGFVYFVTEDSIYKAPKTPGGQATAIYVAPFDKPRYLATQVGIGTLFWSSNGAGSNTGKLFQALRTMTTASSPSPVETGNNLAGVSFDTTYVYWSAGGATQPQGAIRRRQIRGGTAPQDIVTNQLIPGHLLVASGKVFFTTGGAGSRVLYVANASPGATATPVLALDDDLLSALAASSTKIYWVTFTKRNVWSSSLDGSGAQLLHTGPTSGSAIAVDDRGVYVAFQGTFGDGYGDGQIVRVLGPMETEPFATVPFVSGIALDDKFVYAVGGYPRGDAGTAASGTLWRIRR